MMGIGKDGGDAHGLNTRQKASYELQPDKYEKPYF
jgi:hypothetical protein